MSVESAQDDVARALWQLFCAVEGNAKGPDGRYLSVEQAAAAVRHAKNVLQAEQMMDSGTATVQVTRRYSVTFWRSADGEWRIEEIEGDPVDECQIFAVVDGEDYDEWFPFLPSEIGEEIHGLDVEIKISEHVGVEEVAAWVEELEQEKEDLSSP